MKVTQRLKSWLGEYFRWDMYRRLLPYASPYALAMAGVLLFELTYTSLGLLEPWFTKLLIDQGLGGQPVPHWLQGSLSFLAVRGRVGIVLFAVLGGFAYKLLRNVLDIGLSYVKERINSGMILRFASDLFYHLQRLSFSYHDQTTVGDSVYRINNDTSFISTMIWSNFRHLLTSVITLGGILWIVTKLDWQVALLAVAVAPLQFLSVGCYGKLFRNRSLRVKEMESHAQTILQEVLSCLRVVKAFGQEEREHRRLTDRSWDALRARLRLETGRGLFGYGIGLISRIDRTLITLMCGFHVLHGGLTVGEMLVILSYVGQIHDPIEDIGSSLTNMQNTLISAERAFHVLDTEPEIQDRPGASPLERVQGRVVFEDVSFSYVPEQPVLQHVTFTAEAGSIIAVVGPTGAGKSTLASLIMRFYDPKAGRVTLDGHDLRDLTVRTLRDNVALVLQEPVLFSATIRDNIAYGMPEASQEQIVAAARAANAHDFIMALPDGYETATGERGARLSGGERQRIAMARSFLMDAPVLILDEPTSSVDSRTEEVIIDALERLMTGRTTFIIAHRLSTIRAADRILVLDGGRLVEQGTHPELLENSGLYAQLHRIQTSALQRRGRSTPPAEVAA